MPRATIAYSSITRKFTFVSNWSFSLFSSIYGMSSNIITGFSGSEIPFRPTNPSHSSVKLMRWKTISITSKPEDGGVFWSLSYDFWAHISGFHYSLFLFPAFPWLTKRAQTCRSIRGATRFPIESLVFNQNISPKFVPWKSRKSKFPSFQFL